MSEKPKIIQPDPENIHTFLKEKNHWVVWRLIERKDKWTKPPFDAKTGASAKVNDAATWSDFNTAWKAYQAGTYDGIGFMLTEDLGIIGFDFDHCIENEEISPEVKGFTNQLKTYTEKSPSGTGIRAFAFGTLPEGRRKAGPFEVYAGGRYLTVTGALIPGTREIEHRKREITAVYRVIFNKPDDIVSGDKQDRSNYNPPADTQTLLEKAFDSKCGSEIRNLYHGDWESVTGCPSQSEADIKLCKHLSFWLDRDPGRIDQAFRSSGLYREKWNRKTGNSTYGQLTIQKAISQTSTTYQEFTAVRSDNNTGEGGTKKDKDQTNKEKAEQWINQLNKKHAVVMIRGGLYILNEEIDPVYNRPEITFSKVGDFKNRYANKIIINPRNQRDVQGGNYWFNHKDRRSYDGVIFSPDRNMENYYNLWSGFCIKPRQGDWGLMYQHIKDIVCGGNEEYFKFFLAWFARILQAPGGQRPGNAIVLLGKKGTGKGTVIDQFRHILGSHYMSVSRREQITGRFNSHLKNLILLFCDEGSWGGDKESEGALKRLITEPTNPIELKGKDVMQVDSHLNLVMAGNEPWLVPATKDERRYFVLELSDQYLNQYPDKNERDEKIFKPLWQQMNSGGREAMFYDLLHLDISGVNLNSAPRTQALLNQIEQSMKPFERWWYERLLLGENSNDGDWKRELPVQDLMANYNAFVDQLRAKGYRHTDLDFGRELRKLCEGIETYRPGSSGPRPRWYKLPSLNECRDQYQKLINININWNEEI